MESLAGLCMLTVRERYECFSSYLDRRSDKSSQVLSLFFYLNRALLLRLTMASLTSNHDITRPIALVRRASSTGVILSARSGNPVQVSPLIFSSHLLPFSLPFFPSPPHPSSPIPLPIFGLIILISRLVSSTLSFAVLPLVSFPYSRFGPSCNIDARNTDHFERCHDLNHHRDSDLNDSQFRPLYITTLPLSKYVVHQ
jgi:hypothetical protein